MTGTIGEITKDAESRMEKSFANLKTDLGKIRTGRAHTGLLDHVQVDYYGTMTPISQVANVSVEDARTLLVTPWEKTMVQAIERAIMEADLGLNPATAGLVIRIPMPILTEERRKELAKLARSEGEQAKVAIRNIRRDAKHHLKELLKKKEISEDENKQAEDIVQKSTDSSINQVDGTVTNKEKEIMEI